MLSWIRKLKYYPITLTDAVYRKNTGTTLEEILESMENSTAIVETMKKYSDKLKTYRGNFVYDYRSAYRSYDKGDFWIYDGDMPVSVDGSVLQPNGIVYVGTGNGADGMTTNILRTIYVPYENNIKKKDKYDVVIVGGGAGGVGTAYALKDSGLRVALIERLDTLGGTHVNGGVGLLIANPIGNWYKDICQQAYDEGMMEFHTWAASGKKWMEVGEGTDFERGWRGALFSDFKGVLHGYCGSHLNLNGTWFSNKYYNDLKGTIDIFINTELSEVHSDSGKIYEVETINRLNGKHMTLVADYFVDCSADAVLFTKNPDLVLDTDYYIGTDGRARFSETVYSETEEPNKYGINTVEPCYYICSGSTGDYIEYSPSWYKTFDNQVAKGNFGWSQPNVNFMIQSNSYGTGMRLQDFIEKSNDYNMGDGFDRARAYFYGKDGSYNTKMYSGFGGICKMLAIRESYRVACEKTVDQNYLLTQITSDNIASEKTMALSTWYVDIHNQTYSCTSNICNGIPYEAMIPKCYSNVLVASRCYGASHVGLSSVRLVKTMLDLGYSAGKAMIQAVKGQIDVRDVDTAQVQVDTGIADTMAEVETYFYGDTVNYTEVSE